MPDSLTSTVGAAQRLLRERLDATALVALPRVARDHHCRTDSFLIAAGRHVAAVQAVVVPELARLGEPRAAHDLARCCRELDVALLHAKRRLYGHAVGARAPWSAVWSQVTSRFEELLGLETEAVSVLAERCERDALEHLAARLCHEEERAPTRPHPRLPRRGLPRRLARAVWSRVDLVWDALEGRSAPPSTPWVRG